MKLSIFQSCTKVTEGKESPNVNITHFGVKQRPMNIKIRIVFTLCWMLVKWKLQMQPIFRTKNCKLAFWDLILYHKAKVFILIQVNIEQILPNHLSFLWFDRQLFSWSDSTLVGVPPPRPRRHCSSRATERYNL